MSPLESDPRVDGDLQGIAKMGGISGKKKPSDPHAFGEPLVDSVWTDVHELVLVRRRVTGQDMLELFGLASNDFLA